jgi:hypothetical protein
MVNRRTDSKHVGRSHFSSGLLEHSTLILNLADLVESSQILHLDAGSRKAVFSGATRRASVIP